MTEQEDEGKREVRQVLNRWYHSGREFDETSRSTDRKMKRLTIKEGNAVVWVARISFLFCLVVVACLLGGLANYFLKRAERHLSEQQFTSITDRALTTSAEIVIRKRLGTVSMSSVISSAFPNASAWPFVALNGFEMIAKNVIGASSGREFGLAPLLRPDQIKDFEEFAYNYYTRDRVPPFPNGTGHLAGVSQFGFGIWAKNLSMPNTTDQRYHVVDGKNNFNSSYEIVLPILQHNVGVHPVLLLNLYFEPFRASIIDSLLDCAKQRQQVALTSSNVTEYLGIECISVTDIITLVVGDGPAALIIQPIYPNNNDTTVTGLLTSSIVWQEALQNVFSAEVSGLHCIVSTHSNSYTYRIDKGVSRLIGSGDLHDKKFDKYRANISLTGKGLFGGSSAEYTLSVYPTADFFAVYSTANPRVAAIGAVCVILFTSLLFVVYDYFVRREFTAKRELLNAKRQFMRFISHEVRTPLNSVSMGLTLLKDEMEAAFEKEMSPLFNDFNYEKKKSTFADSANSPSINKTLQLLILKAAVTQTKQECMMKDGEGTCSKSLMTTENRGNNIDIEASDCASSHDDDTTSNNECMTPSLSESDTNSKLCDVHVESSNESNRLVGWLQLTSDIHVNALAAVSVLNDLLNYDKIEMGNLKLELTVLNMRDLIQRTFNEFNLPAAKKCINYSISFQCKCQETDSMTTTVSSTDGLMLKPPRHSVRPTVCNMVNQDPGNLSQEMSPVYAIGDSVRLAQSIRNLISNSIKFTPEKGKITVICTWHVPVSNENNHSKKDTYKLSNGETVSYNRNGYLELSVTDTGAGMSPDQLGQLFKDGVQFNVNELQGGNGTGLGLHITKGIIEQHKGALTAISEGLKKGTTFTLTLPVYNVPKQVSTHSLNVRRESATKIDDNHDNASTTLKLLIVDDSRINRKLLKRMLENLGHICEEAENGKVGFDLVEKAMRANLPYDTIFMDSDMPILDGPATAKCIRDIGCETLIIGITGNVMPEDVASFKDHGANAVLPKPFVLDDLKAIWSELGIHV